MDYSYVKFPKESRFLVTGGAGFIGSNLVEVLLNEGYRVRALDNLSNGVFENIEQFLENPNFEFVKGTITDIDICETSCENVDYVLHQAAWGSVPRSIEMPVFYHDVNITGTVNMMNSALKKKVKKFVYASSSSVYGDSSTLPKVEGEEGRLLSPYALTKKVCEEYGKIYSDVYGLETVGLRYFNVFGRRQNPNGTYAAVIPKFINRIIDNEGLIIHGDGEQSRDFTYIENVIEANLKSAASGQNVSGEVLNIAYGGQVSLNELVIKVKELLNKEDVTIEYGAERKGDIRHSNADIGKARSVLGYNPKYDFYSGLEEAIKWYVENK